MFGKAAAEIGLAAEAGGVGDFGDISPVGEEQFVAFFQANGPDKGGDLAVQLAAAEVQVAGEFFDGPFIFGEVREGEVGDFLEEGIGLLKLLGDGLFLLEGGAELVPDALEVGEFVPDQ